jgi:hypothetical protein
MLRFALFVILAIVCFDARAQTPDTVFLEELTWIEVRDAIAAGTEQNGPHIALGKHKNRMNAGSISMPESIYKGILEYTARSLKVHEVIGTHAGLSDTTTLMAVAPQHVPAEFMLAKQDQ